LTDLRTEDSGKLGCQLVDDPDGERYTSLKDFAVTGNTAVVTVCES